MNGIDAALLMLWPPALGLTVQEKALKFLPQVTKSFRPFPSIFADCKQANTGGENGLGTTLF